MIKKRIHRFLSLFIILSIIIQLIPMGVINVKASTTSTITSTSGNEYTVSHKILHEFNINDGDVTIQYSSSSSTTRDIITAKQGEVTITWGKDEASSVVIRGNGISTNTINISSNANNIKPNVYLLDLEWSGQISTYGNTNINILGSLINYNNSGLLNNISTDQLPCLIGYERGTNVAVNSIIPGSTSSTVYFYKLYLKNLDIVCNNISGASTSPANITAARVDIENCNITSTSNNKEFITPKESMTITNSTLNNAKIGTYNAQSMIFTATNSELINTNFYLGIQSGYFGQLNFNNSVFTGSTYFDNSIGGDISKLYLNGSYVDLKTSEIYTLEATASNLALSNSATTIIKSAKFNRVSANSNNTALSTVVKDLSNNPLYFKMIRIKDYPNRYVSVSFDDGFPVIFKTDGYGYIYPYLPNGSTYANIILLDGNKNETDKKFNVTYPEVIGNSSTVHTATEDGSTGEDQSELITKLESQIALLTEQLAQANIDKNALQTENDNLNSQIISLNEIISDLKNQITTLSIQLAESNSSNDSLLSEIERLNNLVTSLNTKVSKLEGDLVTLNNEKLDLETQITTLSNTVTNLNSQITTLNELLATSEIENEGLRGHVNTLTTQINEQLSQIEKLEEDLRLLQTENDELKIQITDLISENTSLLSQIETLKERIQALEIENTELKNKILEFKESILSLKSVNENLQNELEILTESNLALSTQIDTLTSENTDLQSEINRLQDLLDMANMTIEELENRVDDLTNQVSNLENELETAINDKNTLQEENDSLKSQISTLIERISSLEQTIEQLRSEGESSAELIISLNNTIKELNTQINSLQNDLNDANTTITNLNNTIDNLNNNIITLENELTRLSDKTVELEGENEVLKGKIADLISRVSDLEIEVVELNNEIGTLKAEKAEYQSLLADAIASFNTLRSLLDSIKVELGIEDDKDIIPAIKDLKDRLDSEIRKNESLQTVIDTITNDLDAARQENLSLIGKLDSLKELVGASDTVEIFIKIEELINNINESNTRIEQLEKEKNTLIEKLDEAVNKIQDLLTKIEELQEIIDSSDNELVKEISDLKDQIAELRKENEDLESALDQLTKDSNELAKENQFLKSEIIRLESLLDTANSTIDELRDLVASLKVENEALKQQIKDTPTVPSNPSNDGYYQDIIRGKEKEIEDLKSELKKAQIEVEELKKDRIELPKDSVIITIGKDDDLKTIIKEKITTPLDDKISAKKGWEIAETLNSEWVKVIDLDDVIRDKDSSEYSFFAREINNHDKIYYITVTVLVKSEIPSLTLPKTIYLGYKFKLNLGNVEDGNVMFKSSDTSIAKVNKNGVITPVSVGTATITGEVFKDNSYYKFIVKANIKDGGSTLNLKNANKQNISDTPILTMYKLIMKGSSTKLEISNLSKESNVQYITSNAEVVTVDNNGVMNGNKKGNATVTVIIGQGEKIYTYVVKVRVNDGTMDTEKWEYLVN